MIKEYRDLQEWIKDGNVDTFSKHIAKRIDLPTGDKDCFIHFEDPNTSNGWMDFIYCNGTLTIQGDYGNCSLCWYNNNNDISVLAGFAKNMGYFLGKLQSAEKSNIPGRYTRDFDQNICIKEVKEYLEENDIKHKSDEVAYDIENWKDHTEHHSKWVVFCQEYGEDFFEDCDYCEYAYDFGQYTKERVYLWCYGLIKAIEFLENQRTYCPYCKETYQHNDFNSTCRKCEFVGTRDITNTVIGASNE